MDAVPKHDYVIPDELRDSVLTGQCVLCLGAGVSIGEQGVPSGQEMAREMATALRFQTTELSLPRAAQYYEMKAGRHALTRFLVDRVGDVNLQSQASHRLIAALPLSTVVTTNFDRLMELQWERIGVPYDRVIRNEDLSYTQGDRVTYVKLHGSIDMPDSLVVTEDDYERYFEQLGTISLYLKALLASRTLLFVGYSLADPNFKRLYVELTAQVRRHMRRAYAVQLQTSEYDRLWWSSGGRNVHLLEDASAPFLEKLVASVKRPARIRSQLAATLPPPREPYKFLNYYDPEDRAVFFGRADESQEVTNLVLAHRTSLLFGDSGVGKTSLVRAGVTPLLVQEGYRVSYLRVAPGEVADLRRLLVLSAGMPEKAGDYESLEEYLIAHFGLRPRVVVLLDQAEEFFTRNTRQVRRQWSRFLEEFRQVREVDLRLCVICRDDFISDVADLVNEQAGTDVMSRRFKLWKLGPEQTRQCIVRPAAAFGLEFEPGLTNQLVEDLDNRGVDPSQMQVLCSTLYEARPRTSESSVVSMAEYKALGGASGILANYLEQTLTDMEPERREVARAVLKTLVTGDQAKDLRKLEHLAEEALVRRTGAEPDVVADVVDALARKRLVRRLPHSGSIELVHDVLVPRVAEWITQDEAQLKAAQLAIGEGLSNWVSFGEALTRARWSVINERADELALRPDLVLFLLRQSLLLGDHVPYWMMRAEKEGLNVEQSLIDEMTSRGYTVQENVLTALTTADAGLSAQLGAALIAWCSDNGAIPARRWSRRIARSLTGSTTALELLRQQYEEDLIRIPEGPCLIGSDDSVTQDAFEGPQHTVRLGEFHVSKYLVTNAQYQQYVRETGVRPPENWPEGEPLTWLGEYPAVHVSWADAVQYCHWLATVLGRPVRLLTEAEWEKSASWSADEQRSLQFSYGDVFDPGKCNTREAGITEPTAVGAYSSVGGDSPYGLADITGNVWEWTSTRMASPEGKVFLYPYDAADGREDTSDLSAPRILRGGSCYNTRSNAVSSTRFRINPHYRNGDIGFRVAHS